MWLYYILNMLHEEYQGPLPQVFQVISFQLLSVICWGYYLENSFSPTGYDIHQLLFVVWNSEKHFHDQIFRHGSWPLQVIILISLFLSSSLLINLGIWYIFYLLFWWLEIIPRKKSWRWSTLPACVLTRNCQSTVFYRKPSVWPSANQVITLSSWYSHDTNDVLMTEFWVCTFLIPIITLEYCNSINLVQTIWCSIFLLQTF